MSGKRIVEEMPCEHGETQSHVRPGHGPTGSLGQAGLTYANESICSGGSRRVLTEGQYVLIEKVDGEWPKWATNELAAFTAWGADPDLDQILDALSDHTEGTP